MRRRAIRKDGYDHVLLPCKPDGCDHGRCGEHWHYHVVADDGRTGLALEVMTDRMPVAILARPELHERWPRAYIGRMKRGVGGMLVLHVRELEPNADTVEKCEVLGSGPCHGEVCTYIGADELWEQHAVREMPRTPDPQVELGCTPDFFEQPDSFWVALEAVFARYDADERLRRGWGN